MITQAQQAHPQIALHTLCGLFEVSRSWYYQRLGHWPGIEEELALRDAIEQVIVAFPLYGYRRVTAQLQRQGWRVNHKHVLRIMRQESLLCQLKRSFRVTTNAQHGYPTYPNLLAETTLTAPNQAVVGDITYIRLPQAFVYLAVLLDAYSRCCVGWQLSEIIDTQLTLRALDMALSTRALAPGWIHHSDRGVQYAATEYVARLTQAQARISMSAKGNPYDNAKAESFFKSLKAEEVYLNQYRTLAEARSNIGQFIEAVYNTKRLHSSLGYLPPVEFEAFHFENVRLDTVRS